MAINTAARRLSVMDFCSSPYGAAIPLPDGVITGADRLHLLGLYSGFGDDGSAKQSGHFGRMRMTMGM